LGGFECQIITTPSVGNPRVGDWLAALSILTKGDLSNRGGVWLESEGVVFRPKSLGVRCLKDKRYREVPKICL
jgi:hypothetical protein